MRGEEPPRNVGRSAIGCCCGGSISGSASTCFCCHHLRKRSLGALKQEAHPSIPPGVSGSLLRRPGPPSPPDQLTPHPFLLSRRRRYPGLSPLLSALLPPVVPRLTPGRVRLCSCRCRLPRSPHRRLAELSKSVLHGSRAARSHTRDPSGLCRLCLCAPTSLHLPATASASSPPASNMASSSSATASASPCSAVSPATVRHALVLATDRQRRSLNRPPKVPPSALPSH